MRVRTIGSSVTDWLLKSPLNCSRKVHRPALCCCLRSWIRSVFLSAIETFCHGRGGKGFLLCSHQTSVSLDPGALCSGTRRRRHATHAQRSAPWFQSHTWNKITARWKADNNLKTMTCLRKNGNRLFDLSAVFMFRTVRVCRVCVRQFLRFRNAVINRICSTGHSPEQLPGYKWQRNALKLTPSPPHPLILPHMLLNTLSGGGGNAFFFFLLLQARKIKFPIFVDIWQNSPMWSYLILVFPPDSSHAGAERLTPAAGTPLRRSLCAHWLHL